MCECVISVAYLYIRRTFFFVFSFWAQVVTTKDLSARNDNKNKMDCEIAQDYDREATQDDSSMSDSSDVCSICLHEFGE